LPPPYSSREGQRIAKLLARAGIASRREIERMIAEGRIAIDGKNVETPATILTSLHGVTVDGKPVQAPAPARLFRYHKPTGLLTAERDPQGRPTIYDRMPKGLPRLMPVGRLDLNTEGLLLLTTDGGLKRQLELPSSGVERVYRARVFGEISQDRLEGLIEGVEIEGIRYGSIDANLERRTGRNAWVEMRLTEGKNREVRRVLEHLGLKVSRLIRTAYGPFVLGDLPAGEVDEARQHDLVLFRKWLANPTVVRMEPIGNSRPERAERPKADKGGERQSVSRRAAARPASPRAARPGPGRPGRPQSDGEGVGANRKGTGGPRRSGGRPGSARPARAGSGADRPPSHREDADRPRGAPGSRPGQDRSGRPQSDGEGFPAGRKAISGPRGPGGRPGSASPAKGRLGADRPASHREGADKPREAPGSRPGQGRPGRPRSDGEGASVSRKGISGPRGPSGRSGSPRPAGDGSGVDRPASNREGADTPRGAPGSRPGQARPGGKPSPRRPRGPRRP
jgi:23S rRNA pseudouridine2605 synthase